MAVNEIKPSYIRELYMSSTEKTFQYEESLPSLPVPDLSQTLEKYLKSVKPFVNNQQFNKTKEIVQKFEHGIGSYLQEKLLERASKTKNWMHDWWLTYAYLKFRQPLVPYSNMSGIQSLNLTIWEPSVEKKRERIAIQIYLLLESFLSIREEKLRPQMTRKGDKLSMDQFRYLFNTTREPHKNVDKLASYFKTKAEGPCPNHVAVMCNGHAWIITPWHSDHEPYSIPEIMEEIKFIEEQSHALGKGQNIGTLTFDFRDSWAANRELLLSLSDENAENLYLIESALLVYSIHESSPPSLNEAAKMSLNHDIGNRWADKSYNALSFKNGIQASNNDHTPYDGIVTIIFGHYAHEIITEELKGVWSGPNHIGKLEDPKRLVFKLNEDLLMSMEKIRVLNKTMFDGIDLRFLFFNDFGKNWIKSKNLHPDSFTQCALQLAYYKLHNKFAPTYETATTRQFYKARTETCRSCTVEVADFVMTMLSPTSTDLVKKSKLIHAANSHMKLMSECTNAQGIDRHLMGLSLIAAEIGLPELEITKDPSYTLSGGGGNYVLSTSTSGYTYGLGGVPAMVKDGYGVFYAFLPDVDKICFYLTTYKDGDTDIDKYFQSVVEAFRSMKEVLSLPHSTL